MAVRLLIDINTYKVAAQMSQDGVRIFDNRAVSYTHLDVYKRQEKGQCVRVHP